MKSSRPGVGPLEILEGQDDRAGIGQAFEEQTPSAEQVGAVRRGALLHAEQVRQAWLDQPTFAIVGDVLGERGLKLLARGGAVLPLDDLEAATDHLGQRPEGQAGAVGETAPLMPPTLLVDAVDVLEELPQQPRLPQSGFANDRDQLRATLRGTDLGGVDDQPEFTISSDERGLEPDAAQRAAGPRHHAQRRPSMNGLRPSLDLMVTGFLVDNRRLGSAVGDVIHQHRIRRRDRLKPRGRIDRVTVDHAVGLGTDPDRRQTSEHPGARAQLGRANLHAERTNSLKQRQRRADRPLGVVLARHRRAPHRAHGVPDELLHHAAVALDRRPTAREVTREQFADLFGVAIPRQRVEAHEVDEQDRHDPALSGRHPGGRRRRGLAGQWSAAFKTKARAGGSVGPARGTRLRDRRAALHAELLPRRGLTATRRTGDRDERAHSSAASVRTILRSATFQWLLARSGSAAISSNTSW